MMRDAGMIALGAALALAGCGAGGASPRGTAQVPLAAPDTASGRAEHVAEALLAAERAERTADTAALAQAALALERLAPVAQTGEDDATLRRWRASLPAGAPPMRGRALGPAWRSVTLQPGASAQLNQTFLGGRSAQIVVRVTEGSTPNLMVRDQSAREVCRAEKDPVNCRWVPLYTQRHRIEIINSGRRVSKFYIVFD